MNHLKHRVISAVCSITLLSGTFSLPFLLLTQTLLKARKQFLRLLKLLHRLILQLPNLLIQLLQILHLAHRRLTQMLRLKVTTGKFNPIPGFLAKRSASRCRNCHFNGRRFRRILYAKGIVEKRYPASTTKIMTAWLAIENSNLSDQITFSTDAVYSIEPGSTHIGIKPGEILTMEQSLYAVLLASANEVSNGVAEYVGGGSISAFVDKMNERAASLGCNNTHFMNPSGLHDDNHYTTARDLATIARSAFQNKIFRKIIGTEYYIEPKTNITDEERWLNNHNKMLLSGEKHYDGCLGGKTGYTTTAGNTLVTFAERDNMRLVCVVLADTLRFQYSDTASLFDYGFGNFHKEVITENQPETTVQLLPADAFSLKMTTPEFLSCVENGNA